MRGYGCEGVGIGVRQCKRTVGEGMYCHGRIEGSRSVHPSV